jgi:hypothetical protein
MVFLLVGSAGLVYADEQLDMTTPIPNPATTSWKLDMISIARTGKEVRMIFCEPSTTPGVICKEGGKPVTCTVLGDEAVNLSKILNTANLTTNSLQKRALNYAQANGCLPAGTVTGTPDP